jgi:uncharacterized protein YecE (DUF72 family)
MTADPNSFDSAERGEYNDLSAQNEPHNEVDSAGTPRPSRPSREPFLTGLPLVPGMAMEQTAARIRVGTSGFSFDDWLGRAYPAGLAKAKMLEYYETALGFDTVELNFTYYAMPLPKTLASMVSRTSPGFCFVVRSHKDMTHDIWQDEDRRVLKDTADVFRAFREGIAPLVDSGRLGCVLVQFPVFFYPVPQNFDYMRRMPALMPGVSIVVEFRNRAWLRPDAFRLLEESGMGCCVVDEPKIPRLMPFEPRRTSDIAYFRFHGRNQNWFNCSREERYNYLYSREELDEFIPPLRSVSLGARTTYTFFNNCHAGAAARNALMMKQMLGLTDGLTPVQTRVVEGL